MTKFATPSEHIIRTVGATDKATLQADTGVSDTASSWVKFMEFKCGYIPYGYNEYKTRCKKSHRMKSCDFSFYLISKSAVVNIYDKQAQLIAKQQKYPHLDLSSQIKEAEGIIRFEIQYFYSKVYNMIEEIRQKVGRYTLINKLDITRKLLSDATAKEELHDYFSRIIGFGDYYTLPKAKAHVENRCRSPKAERLITTLEFINKSRGIHKAKAILDEEIKSARTSGNMDSFATAKMKAGWFVCSLKELNKLGINPMTIPRDENIPVMDNLYKAYRENQKQNCSLPMWDTYHRKEYEEDYIPGLLDI